MSKVHWFQYTILEIYRKVDKFKVGRFSSYNRSEFDIAKLVAFSLFLDDYEFERIPGINFYQVGIEFKKYNVRAYWNHFKEDTINILLSGSVCDFLEFDIKRWYYHNNQYFKYNISRMDIAIDLDVSLNYFMEKYEKGEWISNFRSHSCVKNISDGKLTGATIYIGSRKSSYIYFKLYDKNAELISKLKGKEKKELIEKIGDRVLTRFEGTFKGDYARQVMDYIIDGGKPADIFIGHVRFIILDRSRKKDCSVDPFYIELMKSTNRIQLGKPEINIGVSFLIEKSLPYIKAFKEHIENYDVDLYERLYNRVESSKNTSKKLEKNHDQIIKALDNYDFRAYHERKE